MTRSYIELFFTGEEYRKNFCNKLANSMLSSRRLTSKATTISTLVLRRLRSIPSFSNDSTIARSTTLCGGTTYTFHTDAFLRLLNDAVTPATKHPLVQNDQSIVMARSDSRLQIVTGLQKLQKEKQQLKIVSTRRWFSDDSSGSKKTGIDEEQEPSIQEGNEGDGGEKEATSAGPTREEQLETELKDLREQMLRTLADMENTRRIARNDVDSAKQFAIKSFAKSLLDVSDNLTRAMEAVPEDVRNDQENNPTLANLYEGIDLTEKGLVKAFQANGVVRFGEVGDVFDPNKHEALFEYMDPEKEAGTIGQVMKPGFFLHKRVLRPAEVGVIKKA